MMKEIVISGSGGQGILTAGLILCEIAINEGKNATWIPSYGPAMRGGKATCTVKLSDRQVGNPCFNQPDILVVMNKPSMEFLGALKPDAVAVINDTPDTQGAGGDYAVHYIPFEPMARNVGNPRAANVVLAGALAALLGFPKDAGVATVCEFFEERGKAKFNEANSQAFSAGYAHMQGALKEGVSA